MKGWKIAILAACLALIGYPGFVAADEKDDAATAASIAKDKATAATAMQQAQAALSQAQLTNLAAQQAYYQSFIPDPSKYKMADVAAPKLNASAASLAFEEADKLAEKVEPLVYKSLFESKTGETCDPNSATKVIASGSNVQALLTQSLATLTTLRLANAKLTTKQTALEKQLEKSTSSAPQPELKLFEAGVSPVGVLSDVAQLGAAFALILKPQRAFETINQQAISDNLFQAMVLNKFATKKCIGVVDPTAIINLAPAPIPGQVYAANSSEELTASAKLMAAVEAARNKLAEAVPAAVATLKDKISAEKNAAKKKAWGQQLADLKATASELSALADECDKANTALYVADAQGNTPIDSAVRGGILRNALKDGAYTMTLKTISSDADIVARDCVFCRYKLSMGSTTIVSWKFADKLGAVVASGAAKWTTPLKKVDLPD